MKKTLIFICRQKISFILHVFLETLQIYCKLVILGTYSIPGYANQSVTINLQKTSTFTNKKPTSSHTLFWSSGYFGHVCLCTTKMIVSTCGTLQSLSASQKYTSSFTFLRYYILKNPAIPLADSTLANNSRTRILPDMELVKYQLKH